MTGVAGQAIVSAACNVTDIWPIAVKMFVRPRGCRSFPRLVILFPRNSHTQAESTLV